MKSVPLSFQNPVEFPALLHFSQHNPLEHRSRIHVSSKSSQKNERGAMSILAF